MVNLKYYEALFENINEIVLVYTPEEVIWANQKALDFWGYDELEKGASYSILSST